MSEMFEKLDAYIGELFAQEDDALLWIQAEAQRSGLPTISVQPFEGKLLYLLVKSLGAKRAVEIGTLAGYSGTWIARALPADGKLYTLERSGKHAAVARASFERAGVADRVELLEGPADQSLERISSKGPFDFVFIDADKPSYSVYFEWAANHLRPGGMVAAHNALRGGRVVAPETDDDRGMANFNRTLAQDSRFDSLILNIGDGTAVGIRKVLNLWPPTT